MREINDEDADLLDLFCDADDDLSPPQRSRPPGRPPPRRHEHSLSHQQGTTNAKTLLHRFPHDNSSANTERRRQSGVEPSRSSPKTTPKKASLIPLVDFSEAYSGLRVRNRLLSAEDMRLRMKGRKVHRLAELKTVPARALESQDPADAWAAVAVLVSKSPRRQAANGGSYSIWTLSDLSRKENDVSLFLFQEALGSHWTVCEGTLLAVLGAKLLPAKEIGDQRLALSVDAPWQVSRVGMAMDYGLCKGKRKDGKPCTMPVNKTEGGGYCEFHVVAAFNRAQRQAPLRAKSSNSNNSSRNSSGSNSGGGNALRAMLRGNADTGRFKQAALPGRSPSNARVSAGPSTSSMTWSQRAAPHAAAPRASTTRGLADIMGSGVKRREDVGAARFGGSATGVRPPPSPADAKALQPTAVRATGRTTLLSSSSSSSSSSSPPPSSSSTGRKSATEAGAVTNAAVGGNNKRLSGGDRGKGRTSPSSADSKRQAGATTEGEEEDLLGLPWAYGGCGSGASQQQNGTEKSDSSRSGTTKTKAAKGGGENRAKNSGARGGLGVVAKKRSRGEAAATRGGQDSGRGGKGPGALDVTAPVEAHPAGYMDGSVVVPAPSNVFKTMPQRYGVRSDGSRTDHGTHKLAEAKFLMNQRLLKRKADEQGVTLRPHDPNVAAVAGGRSRLSAGKKSARSGAASADALLGAGTRGGGKGGDPLSKKIKTMTAVEKEVLLRRVSKYAGLAEEERAKEADKSVQRLEQREAMADKADEVTKMAVTVYHCTECKTKRGYFSKRCRDLGHQQKGTKATLRFFECTNCRRRQSCTDRMPQTGCEGCGRHNVWKRCGARPGRGSGDAPRDKRFVAAMSEWTDRRDLSLAAADFR